MEQNSRIIHRDKRGRLRLSVLCYDGLFGREYSAVVYRFRLLDGDEDGPKLEHAFWFDEDELPTVRELYAIAENAIAQAKLNDISGNHPEAA